MDGRFFPNICDISSPNQKFMISKTYLSPSSYLAFDPFAVGADTPVPRIERNV